MESIGVYTSHLPLNQTSRLRAPVGLDMIVAIIAMIVSTTGQNP